MVVPHRLAVLLTAAALTAQTIQPDGIVNAASYAPACAAHGGIAPGSLFAIFGRDLGPATLASTTFPLKPELQGVSVRIAAAGSTFDALPVYVSATQIGAVLPSAVPPGDGTLSVTYAGRTSAPAPIRVRRAAFGIFTVNQKGSGPAVIQNAVSPGIVAPNTRSASLRPGQWGIIWGTGLGPVSGDESAGPLPADRNDVEVRVWLGDRPARVVYRGRSGCCAGIDQIVFETPPGAEGCQVPVQLEVDGVPSNIGFASVSAQGGPCQARVQPPPIAATSPTFGFGMIVFLDGYGSVLLPSALDDWVRIASFQRGRVEGDPEGQLRAFEPNPEVPDGACWVTTGTDFPPQPRQPGQVPIDAGPELRVTGPGGLYRLLQNKANSGYYEDPQRVAIPAGRYRIDNAAGGPGAGPFSFDADLVTLRLLGPAGPIPRSRELTVTWDYAGPPDRRLTIFGSAAGACGRSEWVSYTCVARAAAGRFTVPARVLSLLPASGSIFGLPYGVLNVSTTTPGGIERFQASGLDLGSFVQISISARQPAYE